jgi:hypothetical protein
VLFREFTFYSFDCGISHGHRRRHCRCLLGKEERAYKVGCAIPIEDWVAG